MQLEAPKFTPLVSIIVPIYNVEKYLCDALDAMIHQTYKYLQIILVDDGSPDTSGSIADAYAKKDTRIQVIHQKNAGVGAARNVGIEHATGEFYMFPDPDDIMDLDIVETLVHEAQNEPGKIAGCMFRKNLTYDSNAHYDTENYSREGLLSATVKPEFFAVWNKLFPSNIVGKIRFPHYCRSEDVLFVFHVYTQSQGMIFSRKPMYYYRINENSITLREFNPRDYETLNAWQDVITFTKKTFPANIETVVSLYAAYIYSIVLKLQKAQLNPMKQEKFLEFLDDLRMKQPTLPFRFKLTNTYASTRDFWIGYILQHSPKCISLRLARISVRICKILGIH